MITKLLARIKILFTILLLTAAGCSMSGSNSYSNNETLHSFTLSGGYFFGPGPIVPDTELPDGKLRGIKFDKQSFSGYATFANDGTPESILSDGVTLINQNIDAGRLNIGDGSNPLLLVAVNSGKNKGREYYNLDDDYRFVWKVDLALDPGFTEGIIQIDDFTLHTGLVKIADSLQTQQGIPGGYDQAGSLQSGQYMAGRVGDYDQDGYIDGILVAAPNVPLESTMLPGSPVGNQRGFTTDIEIGSHLSCELTVRGILHYKEPIIEILADNRMDELITMLKDIQTRISAASKNMTHALLQGEWKEAEFKESANNLIDLLEAAKILNFMSYSFVTGYPNTTGMVSDSVKDAIANMFLKLELLAVQIGELNTKTENSLPVKSDLAI